MAAASACRTLAKELSLLTISDNSVSFDKLCTFSAMYRLLLEMRFLMSMRFFTWTNKGLIMCPQHPGFKHEYSYFVHSDTHAHWNKPTATSWPVWDDSCKCFRSQDFGWSTFISHSHLQRRSFLKNNNLIVTADFSGKDLKCDAPFNFSI